jgi:CS domain
LLSFADIIGTGALPCLALSSQPQTEETVHCRIDHYQTPSTVYVTVFAKQTDKERSSVKIEENEVTDRTAIRHSSNNIKLTCADTP